MALPTIEWESLTPDELVELEKQFSTHKTTLRSKLAAMLGIHEPGEALSTSDKPATRRGRKPNGDRDKQLAAEGIPLPSQRAPAAAGDVEDDSDHAEDDE